jgi:anti-sigma factor RsiW
MSQEASAECSALLAHVSAYLDGDLDAAECQTIELHCRNCSRCAALVEGLRETIGLCREAGASGGT